MENKIVSTIIVFFLGLAQLSAQQLTPKQRQRLDDLGLEYADLIQNSKANEQHIHDILEIDRKRKKNLIMGGSFSGLGLLMLTGGILILSQDGGCDDTHICENTGQVIVGGSLIALGTFEIGISLPLFSSSFKKKKKRDRMIKVLEKQYSVGMDR